MINKPNFFIVGAPKAGTTSMHEMLAKHPEIFMSEPKELNFFSAEELTGQRLYYDPQLTRSETEYYKFFKGANEKIIGESSVSYLFYKEVPKRILKFNVESKILILLRDPVERAFSHYLMDVKLGLCKRSFEELCEDYLAGKRGNHIQQYFELSEYHHQVLRYTDLFKQNVKVILYENLVQNFAQEFAQLIDFLEVDSFDTTLKNSNSYAVPANKMSAMLYGNRTLRKLGNRLLADGIRTKVKDRILKKENKPKLLIQVRKELIDHYEPDITDLETLLNKDLTAWKS